MNQVPGPLAGLRVIEISSFVAAPLGGMALAQLGADVVRIDPIGGAADLHRWPKSMGVSLYWNGLNKGKRSLALDMRTARGRQLVHDLVTALPQGTGVVLTNAVGQDWLSYDVLSALCPDLIHVQVAGHSDGTPAVDYTVNAEVGLPLVTGPAGLADPVNHVLPAWDIACGLFAALGVAAASRRREVSGQGDSLRVALADVALSMVGNLGFLAEAELNKVERQKIGNHLYGGFARDFTTADGERYMVVALSARHWMDLVAVTGTSGVVGALEAQLAVDFSGEDDRFEYREVLAALFQRWFSNRSSEAVEAALNATSLLWSRYRSFSQAVQHLKSTAGANPIVVDVEQPGLGKHLMVGSPLTLRSAPSAPQPAPIHGTDTADVLTEVLGLDESDIAALSGSGVIHPCRPVQEGGHRERA